MIHYFTDSPIIINLTILGAMFLMYTVGYYEGRNSNTLTSH